MPSNPQDRSFIDVRQGLQQALTQVQKPARYTGGEYNEVIKDPAGIDVLPSILVRITVWLLPGMVNSLLRTAAVPRKEDTPGTTS